MLLSNRSKYFSNPIEEEDKLAEEIEKKGKKVYRLNRGDPAKYFPTPKYIIKAYKEALDKGMTSYISAEGSKTLKEAVVKRYSRVYNLNLSNDDVLVTTGVSEAIMLLNSTLINEGDNAILFKPYYPLYVPFLKIFGGEPIFEKYDEKNNWNIDIEGLTASLKRAKASGKIKRTKYLMLTNPNNPTGTVLKKSILKEVVGIANEYGILLISDEIYDEITYNKTSFTSVSQVAKGVPHIILNGMSKDYDSTGFRIGFAIIPESDSKSESIKERIYQYTQMRLSVNTPAQFAAAEAMNNTKEHNKSIKSMVKSIEDRANHATKLLNENPALETVEPNGAFYILPRLNLNKLKLKNDKEFVELLLAKEGIQVTRGSGFGADSHFRIVALPPKEILDYTINRINALCKAQSR